MKPYQTINHIVSDIIYDVCSYDIEHYRFMDDIRVQFKDGKSNLTHHKFVDHKTYWDPQRRTWRNHADNNSTKGAKNRVYPGVIDHSFEPIWYDMDREFWDIRNNLSLHLPVDNCTAPYPNPSSYPLFVLHSEHASPDVAQLEQLGYRTAHWFSHAYLCSEFYFRPYQHLRRVYDYTKRPIWYPWVCANRLIRPHRTDFLELLDLSKGTYSLLGKDCRGTVYEGPVPPRSFDTHHNSSAEINFDGLEDFNTSFLHVVSETVWQTKIHLTEKIFKPIVLHQPFVLLQAPGSLEYLRSYGFRTFGDWWDESYDSEQDPAVRMQKIADIVNWIPSLDLNRMRGEMAEVLEHNFNHFFTAIPALVLDELRAQLSMTLGSYSG